MAGKTVHAADHRHNAEELLSQLAGLMYEDMVSDHVRLARRRRTLARHSIMGRLAATRRSRPAAAAA
jgi:hypothetical protein